MRTHVMPPILVVWDLDDTLFETETYVSIINKITGQCIDKISTQQYKSYDLADDCRFEFNGFNDAQFFRDTSQPIRLSLKILLSQQNLAKQINHYDMVLITGRNVFDNQQMFLEHLESHLIDTKTIDIICVGDFDAKSTAAKKMIALKPIIAKKSYNTVIMYDDDSRNLRSAQDVVGVDKFIGWHFDGNAFKQYR